MPRCGTMVLAGRPNTGKSTLLNTLVGQHLAITSPKPQSTRLPVVGIRTVDDCQLILRDAPGLLDPAYLLHDAMLQAASDTLRGADALLYLHPITDRPVPEPDLLAHPALAAAPAARLIVLTKADLTHQPLEGPAADQRYLRVSAVTGQGVPELLAWCVAQAPERPFRYPDDDVSSQPVRFFAGEFVREAAFDLLGDELPYALAVEVDEFREDSHPLYIRATIYVERDSQKAMVIGRGGRTIKALGTRARRAIEPLVADSVFLDLHVKTLRRWRSSPSALQRFGFTVPEARRP